MNNRCMKNGMMIIAIVLLIGVCAGAASAATVDIGSADEWNAFAASVNGGDATNKTTDINITNSFSFSGFTPVMLGTNTDRYSGTVEGNRWTIADFIIEGGSSDKIGLIGCYEGSHIGNLTLCNFSVSGGDNVGGLIGRADSTLTIEHTHAEFGNVSGRVSVGGLVGYAYSANFVGCSASCMYVSGSNQNVGGLVGYADSANFDADCSVLESEIASNVNHVGGLAGIVEFASVHGAWVKDCLLGGSSGCVGGVFGLTVTRSTYEGVIVENCTIAGDSSVGGLVGCTFSSSNFETATSWVNYTWVNGSSNVGSIGGGYISGGNIAYPPLHTEVYNGTGGTPDSQEITEIDNTFNGISPAYPISIGTRIGSTLLAGTDYGFGSAPEYTITNRSSDPSKGSTTFSMTEAGVAARVTATATANPGYYFVNWTCVNLTPATVTMNPYTFTMPAMNVSLTANFVANVTTILFYNDTSFIESKANIFGTEVNFTAVPTKSGYTGHWNVSESGKPLTDSMYVSGTNWTFAGDDNSVLNAFVNWTVNRTDVSASNNTAEFGNHNLTVLRSTTGTVKSILLENVTGVTNTPVTFVADNSTVGDIPDISGYTKDQIAIFDINATVNVSPAQFILTVTFKDEPTATAEKDKVIFRHFNTTNNAWDGQPLTVSNMVQNHEKVTYMVETSSFSPFGMGLYSPIPQQIYFGGSSSRHQGGSMWAQNPNDVPTVAPTVTPTAVPVYDTPTAAPTAQPTQSQKSPAPVVGLIAGLGITGLVLRLRK